MKIQKTNALRMLDDADVKYEVKQYPTDGPIDGVSVATYLQEDVDMVYKTLVCIAPSKHYYVFCIPVKESLDFKKCAKVVKEKSIEMIPQKQLLPLTGYMHGGCSPVGMKKKFTTVVQEDCILQEKIYVSAGKIGMQMYVSVEDLFRVVDATVADVIVKKD